MGSTLYHIRTHQSRRPLVTKRVVPKIAVLYWDLEGGPSLENHPSWFFSRYPLRNKGALFPTIWL